MGSARYAGSGTDTAEEDISAMKKPPTMKACIRRIIRKLNEEKS